MLNGGIEIIFLETIRSGLKDDVLEYTGALRQMCYDQNIVYCPWILCFQLFIMNSEVLLSCMWIVGVWDMHDLRDKGHREFFFPQFLYEIHDFKIR